MTISTKTARAAIAALWVWAGPVSAQSLPDDTGVVATAIADTGLIIDVPLTWEELPKDMVVGDGLSSLFAGDGQAEDELATFMHIGADSSGVMVISRGLGYTRPPQAELAIMAQGIRLSRTLTWIVGAGMKITVPPERLPLGDGIEAATMTFLSGQAGSHEEISFTILKTSAETILIVDIARQGADEIATLRAMRRSIRLQG